MEIENVTNEVDLVPPFTEDSTGDDLSSDTHTTYSPDINSCRSMTVSGKNDTSTVTVTVKKFHTFTVSS